MTSTRSAPSPAGPTEPRRRARADVVLRKVAADIFAGAPGLDETLERVTAAAQRALRAERATCYVTTAQERVAMVHTTERDPARRALIEDSVGRGPDEMP